MLARGGYYARALSTGSFGRMRRLIFSAYLLSAALAMGCSSEGNGGESDGDDDKTGETRDGGIKKDGGKDGGKTDGGKNEPDAKPDGGKGGGGIVIDDEAPPFDKDATGDSDVSPGDIEDLKAGGGECAGRLLYPYDGTIFPAGLTSPTVMWEGAASAAYVKLSYEGQQSLNYQAAFSTSEPGEFRIVQEDWNEIVRRTQGNDMLVTISLKSGGGVCTYNQKWKIAAGAMTGALFYNTYNHPDKLGNGAVMRLELGQPDSEIYLSYQGPTAIAGPCVSCHSVSANGEKLAASLHDYTPFLWQYKAASYEIAPEVEPPVLSNLPESTFGAFTPKGKEILSMGNPECTNGSNAFARSPNNFPLVPGPVEATLHDSATGAAIPAQGLKPEWFMWMPQFSPDGTKVAFNHAKIGADGRTDRRELAVMDYDAASHTFSNLKVVVSNQGPEPSIDYAPLPTGSFGAPAGNNCSTNTPSDVGAIPGGTCTGPCYPGWPFFTPDGDALVYSLISEPDFMAAFPGRDVASKSEIWYVDIKTGDKVRLDAANDSGGEERAMANYYPTMLPVPIGGYYWLFWTSTRDWGHRNTNTTPLQAAANWFGGASVAEAARKRIWVSAIKPRGTFEGGVEKIQDTSAPGFYLEGQTASGNVRAFATLNPCQQDGIECSSGLDCCSGYCDIKKGQDKGVCVPEKTCSNPQEKCMDDMDCCPPEDGGQARICLGGTCTYDVQ